MCVMLICELISCSMLIVCSKFVVVMHADGKQLMAEVIYPLGVILMIMVSDSDTGWEC